MGVSDPITLLGLERSEFHIASAVIRRAVELDVERRLAEREALAVEIANRLAKIMSRMF